MTVPTYQSTTATDFASDVTSHAANMPATVSANDLLLAIASFDSSSTTITTPSGWTLLYTANATDPITAIFGKLASGSEGGTTVDFATSNAQQGSVQVIRISGWAADLNALRISAGDGESSSNTGLCLAMGTTARDILWIYAQAKSSTVAWVNSPPTGYTNETKSGADLSTSAAVASATKAATSVSHEEAPTIWLSGAASARPGFLVGVPNTA